ncbi:hypothetical protein CgunFtcFv8_013972 [Champsocephalus gunnari]|uniref:Uncharacterized protein n=2 Tax=Champsocephalus TaxID=52236 RepID=A0AAN8E8P1_CHAGU|nr:hypothetical protein CgunFtcFv8_013972 [Champsocephalus gunnari]
MTGLDYISGTTSRGLLSLGIHQLCGPEDDGKLLEQVTGIDVRSGAASPRMDSLLTFYLGCRRLYVFSDKHLNS